MTTWTEFLTDIRADLQDTGTTPRWSDRMLFIYTRDAVRDYSMYFPMRVDRKELSLTDGKCSLPSDFIAEIYIEAPQGTFLEKRQDRPGIRFAMFPKIPAYYIQGGSLYIAGSREGVVYLTYHAAHPVPTSEKDETFQFTVPDVDLELVRIYVKWKVYSQLRGKQANLDRFKTGSGQRDDNPVEPETDGLLRDYQQKISERVSGGLVYLYRPGRLK